MNIPNYLKSTYDMLKSTFPRGINQDEYWIVLYLLYNYMSDENLSYTMQYFINKPGYEVKNDIYRMVSMNLNQSLVFIVQEKLNSNGFQKWKLEV